MEQKGFTLIEVMVTIAIFVVLIFAVSTMLTDIFVKSKQQLSSLTSIDQARSAMTTFTNEVRDATMGSDGSYAINQVGDSQIIFYSNYKISNGAAKRIRYYLSGSTLYKGVVLATGSPLAYNLSSETVSTVISGVANGVVPVFYYYDGSYNGSANPLIQPVNINQVRFVKISLMVLNQTAQNSTSTFSISAGATIRSLKDNLGN